MQVLCAHARFSNMRLSAAADKQGREKGASQCQSCQIRASVMGLCALRISVSCVRISGGATRRMQPPSLGLSDQRSNPNRVVFLILVRPLVWSALPNLPRAEKSALLMTDLWGLVFLSPPVKQTVFACSYLPKLYKPQGDGGSPERVPMCC